MKLHFYKYQGTGNDFVMIDDRFNRFDTTNNELVKRLCDRRFGIGADGLILLRDHPQLDFEMVYYNSDGNTSTMCGNGGRCLVKFAHDLNVVKDKTTFMAVDGEHDAFIKDGLVHLKMIDVKTVEDNGNHYFMNTGSPHYVQAVRNIQQYDVYGEGRAVRYNERFRTAGTNVNFTEKVGDTLWVRTYERGVEDETFSCGTGVTAAAIAASFEGVASPVKIKTKGGDLGVSFRKDENGFKDVFLIGPALKVFEGFIEI